MKLGNTLSEMFSLYAKRPLLFSGIAFITTFPFILIDFYFGPESDLFKDKSFEYFTSNFGAYFLIILTIAVILGAIAFGATFKAIDSVKNGKKITFEKSFSYGFKRIGKYILMMLLVFIYTGLWLPILLVLLKPILDPLFSNITIYFTVAFVFLFIVIAIRSVRAFFAFYILYDSDKIGVNDALHKSIKLSTGSFWRIVGYWFVIVLLVLVIELVLNSIIGNSPSFQQISAFNFDSEPNTTIAIFVDLISAIVLGPLAFIYFYLFYKGLKKEKGMS